MRTYLFVAYDLATANLAKAREDELQILAARHGIELAHKKHVLGRLDVGVRQVADLVGEVFVSAPRGAVCHRWLVALFEASETERTHRLEQCLRRLGVSSARVTCEDDAVPAVLDLLARHARG